VYLTERQHGLYKSTLRSVTQQGKNTHHWCFWSFHLINIFCLFYSRRCFSDHSNDFAWAVVWDVKTICSHWKLILSSLKIATFERFHLYKVKEKLSGVKVFDSVTFFDSVTPATRGNLHYNSVLFVVSPYFQRAQNYSCLWSWQFYDALNRLHK